VPGSTNSSRLAERLEDVRLPNLICGHGAANDPNTNINYGRVICPTATKYEEYSDGIVVMRIFPSEEDPFGLFTGPNPRRMDQYAKTHASDGILTVGSAATWSQALGLGC